MKNVILLFVMIASVAVLHANPPDSIPVKGGKSIRQYELLQKAIEEYTELKEKGDWNEIKLPGKTKLKLQDRSPIIPDIKKRLSLLGDFRTLSYNDVFTARLEDAVRRFQARHGLEESGVIDASFIKSLNVHPDLRIRQMEINRDRLLMEPVNGNGKLIIANIPEYKLHVYEGKHEVLTMDIVVGKTTNQTVVFSDEMKQIVFSPYWNIPESIVRNEILPAMKKNPRYLKNNRMEIVGTRNGLPEIRQKPGPQNSLGKVKFLFPNKYNIYFHDTPAKTLFQRRTRAFSHGCIRLSKPFELAKYLLKDDPDWNDEAIERAMNAGKEKWVTLNEPIPVSISYYTAWVDQSGAINFREDIYGRDKQMADNN